MICAGYVQTPDTSGATAVMATVMGVMVLGITVVNVSDMGTGEPMVAPSAVLVKIKMGGLVESAQVTLVNTAVAVTK